VSWDKPHKKWEVQTTDKGKTKNIGNYDDETAAARAFDAYAIAKKIITDLNFPSAPGVAGHRTTTKKGRTSSHRGVNWHKPAKKWVARIWVDGTNKHLGSFVDEDDAGRAYDAAIRKYYPNDKKPHKWKGFNFPPADGEEGSADGGDYTGSARGGASNSSATVDARAAEKEEEEGVEEEDEGEEEEDEEGEEEEEEEPPRRRRRHRHRDTRTVAQARADNEPFSKFLRDRYTEPLFVPLQVFMSS
jgi:hypothetical protein